MNDRNGKSPDALQNANSGMVQPAGYPHGGQPEPASIIPNSSPNPPAPGKLDNNQPPEHDTQPAIDQALIPIIPAAGNMYNHPAGVAAALRDMETKPAPDMSNTARQPDKPSMDPNDPNRWTYIDKSGRRKRFSAKQIIVIQKLLAGMPGNQAVLTTQGYNQTLKSASVTASKLLETANNHGIIQREMELAGIGRSVQMGALSDVIHNRYITEDVQEYVDENGKPYRKVITRRKPTARDVVSAISTADRISGAKEARRVQADAVSSELKALFKRYSPASALKDVSDRPVESPLSPIGGPTTQDADGGIDDSDLGVLGLTTEQVEIQPDSKSGVSACTTSDTNEHERAWQSWAGEGEGGNGRGA